MAILEILQYPDSRLNTPAQRVEKIDAATRKLIDDLAETMYAAPGVGLAATQVDVHEQIIVIDVSEAKNDLRVFINPEILWASEETTLCEEGCLSVPGVYEEVRRPTAIRVRARTVDGTAFELDAQGLLAVCVQHEM